jgi:hypothetical protein
MSNPWTILGDRVLISAPQFTWEKNGLPINEGPEILIHNGQLHIIFSASGYWTNQYALGRLTYKGTGSLLNATSWTKATQPVFQATSLVTGPGHASFVMSVDGTENWIVYHAHANPTVFNDDRVIRMQPFEFRADGTPNFGSPLAPGTQLSVPSKGPDEERPILVGDFQADGVVDDLDYNVWRATFGTTVFAGSAADPNGDGVVDTADYIVWRSRQEAIATPTAAAGIKAVDAPALVGAASAGLIAEPIAEVSKVDGNEIGSFAMAYRTEPLVARFNESRHRSRSASLDGRLSPTVLENSRLRERDLALAYWSETAVDHRDAKWFGPARRRDREEELHGRFISDELNDVAWSQFTDTAKLESLPL